MLDPQLRELVRRVRWQMPVEVRECGDASPSRAMDCDPVGCEWSEMQHRIEGVADGLGVQVQHGVTERHFTIHEPCTHPGHYELE